MNWINSFLSSVNSLLGALPISWVDFITLIILGIGFVRGRKRGLSEELLDTTQWLLIVVVGAFLYHTLAGLVRQGPVLSVATCCIISYIVIALLLKILFSFFKRHFGQKLVESDIF